LCAPVRTVRDFKGKTLAVRQLGSTEHTFISSILAYIGINPQKELYWVTHPFEASTQLFAAGKTAAVATQPPQSRELRARQIGHVLINSTVHRPWSQYYCCMVYTHEAFVQQYPVATKRVLRAILKAADLCASGPERMARFLVDEGYTTNYDYARNTIQEVVYRRWREYNPEDTVRFYALRLHEAGMLKSTSQKIIARGTDWRFLNELKQELKG
jgi:NitT/TauT family transport system substrate-binding protein